MGIFDNFRERQADKRRAYWADRVPLSVPLDQFLEQNGHPPDFYFGPEIMPALSPAEKAAQREKVGKDIGALVRHNRELEERLGRPLTLQEEVGPLPTNLEAWYDEPGKDI